jgi:predicted nicotinamide N-methyase
MDDTFRQLAAEMKRRGFGKQVLLLWGEGDLTCPLSSAQLLMSYFNGGFSPGRPLQQNTAELCVISQARHSVVLERAPEVGAAIGLFLLDQQGRSEDADYAVQAARAGSQQAGEPESRGAGTGRAAEEAMRTKQADDETSAAKAEQQIMHAALDGREPPVGRKPFAIVMWGGIGAGKSTASTQVFETLGMADVSQSMVDLNVDELVQSVPEFRASIGTDHEEEAYTEAYMLYRKVAKQIQKPLAQASLEQGLDVYVEWTYEGNMHALSKAESDVLQREALEAKGYIVVLCLVECRDVEGILVATKEREKVDGRHIPEAVIRTYNQDRATHWLTALANWSIGVVVRALVETRLGAGSAGEGLIEMSADELSAGWRQGVGKGETTEDAACAYIDGVRAAREGGGGERGSDDADDADDAEEWAEPETLEDGSDAESGAESDDFHDAHECGGGGDGNGGGDGGGGDGACEEWDDEWGGVLGEEESKKLAAALAAEKASYESYEADVEGLGYIFGAHDASEDWGEEEGVEEGVEGGVEGGVDAQQLEMFGLASRMWKWKWDASSSSSFSSSSSAFSGAPYELEVHYHLAQEAHGHGNVVWCAATLLAELIATEAAVVAAGGSYTNTHNEGAHQTSSTAMQHARAKAKHTAPNAKEAAAAAKLATSSPASGSCSTEGTETATSLEPVPLLGRSIAGLRVVEMGAGCGIPSGVCVACGAAAVVYTDGDSAPSHMLAMTRSAKANKAKANKDTEGGGRPGPGGIHVRSFWWGGDVAPLLACSSAAGTGGSGGSGEYGGIGGGTSAAAAGGDGRFDVVIVADCIYNPSLHDGLLRSCHQLLRRSKTEDDEGGVVLVAFSLHPNTSHESVFGFFDKAASDQFDPPFVVTKLLERQCTPHESNAHAAESNLRSYVWCYKMTLPPMQN